MIAHPTAKTSNPPSELVNVLDLFAALGYARGVGTKRLDSLIDRYGVTVLHSAPYGRGYARLMSRAQYDELVAKHGKKPAAPAEPEAESEAEIHLGALEAKVDRLEEILRGNTQAINELVKSSNLFADRLGKLLKQLGEAP